MNKTILCVGLSITFMFTSFVASKALAGEKLVLGMDIRFRYEFQDNFNQKYYGDNPKQGASDDGFLLGRFRAGLDYRPFETIHLTLWMQHSEVWDMALPDSAFYNQKLGCEHNPNKDPWELSDTYMELKRPFELPLIFKGGRQRIIYGNKRIFGPGQWGNTGRWIWDAVSLSYPFDMGFVDVYYGRTVIHDPDELSLGHRHFYESLGSYGRFTLPQNRLRVVFEPFMMTKRDNHNVYTAEDGITKDLDAYYAGIRIFRTDLRGIDLDMTYLREFGDYSHDALKAYGYHILFAYHFKASRIKPRVSVEYSVASGDSDPTDGDRETFDGAFGARDKMYGRMNLFHWMNIEDAQINLEGNPSDWCYFKLEFHQFWLAEEKDAWYLNAKEYRDKTGESGHAVGKELDMVVKIDLPRRNEMDLTNNSRRAIFVSTVNAVMRHPGMIERSVHCKDNGPNVGARELVDYIKKDFGTPRIALVGLQPRMLEALSKEFQVRVTDLDEENIGREKFGIMIESPEQTKANLKWCELALVTGTTLVNDTIGSFTTEKTTIFFGVTIAGPARLLGLTHFCPCST